MQSYIVNSVRTARGSAKIAYYQPLTLLNLVVYHRDGADINRISQVQFFDPTLLPSTDIRKSTVRLFLSEVLTRVLREEEPNPQKFDFIFASLQAFEHSDTHFENFHLQFLLRLMVRLGFGITDASELYHQIYKLDQRFANASGLAHKEEQEAMQSLLETPYFTSLVVPGSLRRQLLEDLIRFYREHIADMPQIRSLEVLQEVFS